MPLKTGARSGHPTRNASSSISPPQTTCGAATYQVIRNITTPGKSTDHTFKELVQLVQAHRNPSPSVTVKRFTFNTRSQKDGEMVSWQNSTACPHVAHLMSAWTICCVISTLVCGVRDTRVQCRLLAQPNLTFKKAFEICQSAEMAEKNAREMQMSQKYKVSSLLGYHQLSCSKEPETPLSCY